MTTTIQRINFYEHGLRCSTGQVYTYSEIEAMNLIGWPSATDSKFTPHDAGNQVIALAEQIKAERAIMTMEKP